MRNIALAFGLAFFVGFFGARAPAEAGERRQNASGCLMTIIDAGYADTYDSGCPNLGVGLWYTFQCDAGVYYTKDGNIPTPGLDPKVNPGDPYPFVAQQCGGGVFSTTACPLRFTPAPGTSASCNLFASDGN